MFFRHGIKPSDALEVIEVIIRLLCAKHIRVLRGTCARTDGKGMIELPPLPPDSTEEDQILFLGYGLHEGSHFTAGSIPARMSKNRLRHSCENGVDDVRSEKNQEEKYTGITYWRKVWYKILYDKEISPRMPVQTKKDMADFLHKLICLMIFRTREQQLDIKLGLNPSAELLEVYNKYLLDLEDTVKACKTFDDSLRVGGLVYDRIKKFVKDDVASKMPEPKKPEKKEKKSDGAASKSKPEKSDETDKEDTGDSSGEDTSEESSDTEPGDTDSKGDTVNDKDTEDSNTEEASGDTGDSDQDDKTSSEPEGSDVSDGEPEESVPESEKDTGDASGESGDSDTGEGTSESDPVAAEPESDSDERKGKADTGSDSTDADEEAERIAEEEYKDACKERKHAIEEETKRVLRGVEDTPEDFKMPVEIWVEKINRLVTSSSGPYMVSKSVIDSIGYVPESEIGYAEGFKKVGISLLGTKGDSMTRLFVSQTRPRTIYNQRSGSFDMMSFMQDVSDSRMDLYTVEQEGCLDKAAVSFMMDNSSSMSGVIGKAYALLSGFMHYLCRAAIPVEAIGFTAQTCYNPEYRDTPVFLQIIKKFEDPYDSKVIRRCVPPGHMDQNAEVDCLRYMVPRLLKRHEGKKILFVVGDGQPCIGDNDLNDKLSVAYKEYLDLCRKTGILVFGFGIRCDLSEYFGEDFISVDASDMGEVIQRKLTELLNRKRAIV